MTMMTMSFVGFLLIAIVIANETDGDAIISRSLTSNCPVKHGAKLLNEGEKVIIRGKLYKVENCQLQRAYQACGPNLWHAIHLVCEAIHQQSKAKKSIVGKRNRRFAKQELLTEACCENYCTVHEMTRYCPS